MSVQPIDVTDLVGHPGASRIVEVDGTLEGLATALVRVPDDARVHGELLLESVVEGLWVTGTVETAWVVSCARCLRETPGEVRAHVEELFVPHPGEDEDAYPLDPEAGLDPDQLLRDAIGVEMPFAPLCRPDCLGLCEVCGGDRNVGGCPGHQEVDPRFAVLSELVLPDLEP
jgi:DUF177 domain-containing protein